MPTDKAEPFGARVWLNEGEPSPSLRGYRRAGVEKAELLTCR